MAQRILKSFIALSTAFAFFAAVALAVQERPQEQLFALTVSIVAINAITLIVWEFVSRMETMLNEWKCNDDAFVVEDDLEHDRSE